MDKFSVKKGQSNQEIKDNQDNNISDRRGFCTQILRLGAVFALPSFFSFSAHAKEPETGNHLVALRTWPSEEYTRITLELKQPLNTDHIQLEKPNRLVVTVKRLNSPDLLALPKRILAKDAFVKSVKVQQLKDEVKLIFTLKQEIIPEVFTLKPIAKYQYRLMIDIYPKKEHDQMANLLSYIDHDDDPLAGLINKLSKDSKQANSNKTNKAKNVAKNKDANKPKNETKQVARKRKLIIAIDPGHGGEAVGAVGSKHKTLEKDVVLSISKKLAAMVNNLPNMHSFLTRNADFSVSLTQRVRKAMKVNADLFISIHADHFSDSNARGVSVFVLSEKGASSSQALKLLANKENQDDLISGIAHSKGGTIINNSHNQQIDQSLKFGQSVLNSLGNMQGIRTRRIGRAGFVVLKAPNIPSILVETAFLSNAEDEQLLRSQVYQNKIAQGILNGIKDYVKTRT